VPCLLIGKPTKLLGSIDRSLSRFTKTQSSSSLRLLKDDDLVLVGATDVAESVWNGIVSETKAEVAYPITNSTVGCGR
jgi:hypothetical protein